MLKIKIEITKRYWFIKTNKTVERDIWESWQEVPAEHRSTLINYVLQYPDYADLYALRLMLDIKTDFLVLDLIAPDELAALRSRLDWIKIVPDATPLIDAFEHNGKGYRFIKANFENGKAIEYALIDRYYKSFLDTKSETELINLVAVVCREITNDDLTKFVKNTDEVEQRAKALTDVPTAIIVAVLAYVEGIRKLIHDVYAEYLFSEPLTEEQIQNLKDMGQQPEEDPLGWYSLYMTMAGNAANLTTVEQMDFHTLCAMRVKDIKEQRKQQKTHTNEL